MSKYFKTPSAFTVEIVAKIFLSGFIGWIYLCKLLECKVRYVATFKILVINDRQTCIPIIYEIISMASIAWYFFLYPLFSNGQRCFFYVSRWKCYQLSDIKSIRFTKCSRCVNHICLLCPLDSLCMLCHGNWYIFIYIFLFLWNRIEIKQQPHTVYGNGISHQAAWLHFCKQSIKQSHSTIVTTTTN